MKRSALSVAALAGLTSVLAALATPVAAQAPASTLGQASIQALVQQCVAAGVLKAEQVAAFNDEQLLAAVDQCTKQLQAAAPAAQPRASAPARTAYAPTAGGNSYNGGSRSYGYDTSYGDRYTPHYKSTKHEPWHAKTETLPTKADPVPAPTPPKTEGPTKAENLAKLDAAIAGIKGQRQAIEAATLGLPPLVRQAQLAQVDQQLRAVEAQRAALAASNAAIAKRNLALAQKAKPQAPTTSTAAKGTPLAGKTAGTVLAPKSLTGSQSTQVQTKPLTTRPAGQVATGQASSKPVVRPNRQVARS